MPSVNVGQANIAIRTRDENTTRVAREVANRMRTLRDRTQQVNRELRTLNTVSRTTRNVLGGLGILALTGNIRNFANEAAELGASLVESANTAGLSVEQFQLLQRTFEGDGVAAESFRASMTFLQRRLGDLERQVPTTVEYFDALGLTWENLRGQDLNTILEGIADGLRNVEDPNLRVAIATQLLGRSAADMVNVLQGGSAALREGTREFRLFDVVSTETAQTLKALQQEFTNTGIVIAVNLAQTIAQNAPAITEFTRDLRDVSVNFQRIARDVTQGFIDIGETIARFAAFPAALYAIRVLLTDYRAILQSVTTTNSFLTAVFTRLGAAVFTFFSALQSLLTILIPVEVGLRLIFDQMRSFNEETAAASDSLFRLNRRMEELQQRITEFGIEGEGLGFLGRFFNAAGVAADLRELETIQRRVFQLSSEQNLRRLTPGLPRGYNIITGRVVDPAVAAQQRRDEQNAEANQERLNQFARDRIALYERLADLRRQVEIPEEAQAETPPAINALEQIQASVNRATLEAIQNAGDLNDELDNYRRILADVANQRFLDNELITIGLRQNERALDAQVRAGEISREVADARLIVNQRIAELSRQVLQTTGSERDAIVAVIDNLQQRYPEIVEQLAEAMQGLTDTLSIQAQVLQTTFESIGRGLERGILRAVRQGGNLLDIFKQIGQEILGTILSNLTRLGINTLFASIGIPGFQFGGVTRPNSLNVVGERGPELIYTANAARVTPFNQVGSGATINIDARGGDQAGVYQAIRRTLPAIAEAIGVQNQNEIRFALENPSPLYQG